MHKVKKKRLSISYLFKIAFSDIFIRPFRLAFTILLAIFALTLTGFATTIALYNEDSAKIKLYAQKLEYFRLWKDEAKIVGDEISGAISLPFGSVVHMEEEFLNAMKLTCVDETEFEDWGVKIITYQQENMVHVQTGIESIGYFPEEVTTALGSLMLAGAYPEEENEVAVSSCFANAFLAADWYDGSTTIEIKQYSDLIGKSFLVQDNLNEIGNVSISGVYNCYGCNAGGNSIVWNCAQDYYDWHGSLFVSKTLLYDILDASAGADVLYYTSDHNTKTGEQVVSFLSVSDLYCTDAFESVVRCRADIEQMRNWAIGISMVLIVFSTLLLYQFIAIMVDYKKPIMGVLRMLGARSSICIKIVIIESITIGGVAGLLSAALSSVCLPIVNMIFAWFFHEEIVIADFKILSLVTVYFLGLLAGFIAALPPSIYLTRSRPVDFKIK